MGLFIRLISPFRVNNTHLKITNIFTRRANIFDSHNLLSILYYHFSPVRKMQELKYKTWLFAERLCVELGIG